MKTGFKDIDELIELRNGELILIGGRPGMRQNFIST